MTTKARLLAAYAHKPVTRLAQFDCFAAKRCDDIIADCGGYGLTMSVTHELMIMAPDARLLVKPDADLESVQRWLVAMAEKVQSEMRFVLASSGSETNAMSDLRDAIEVARGEAIAHDARRSYADA